MGNHKRGAKKGFAFVIADAHGKPQSEDRKLIRSHAMRGKNTRASRAGPSLSSSTSRSNTDRPQSSKKRAPPVPKAGPRNEEDSDKWFGDEEELFSTCLKVSRTPNDLCMFQFADGVDSTSQAMLFEFYAVIKEAMFPVEWCFRFDVTKTPWFYWLLSDAAFLHSVLFTVGLLHDQSSGSKPSKTTKFHIWKSLNLLNQNINSQGMALADSTVATIVAMCIVTVIFGDMTATAAHVAGLRKIVDLRGGVENFRHNLQLYAKIYHVDIGWTLCTGDKPLYYSDKLSWEPAFASILGPLPDELQNQLRYGPVWELLYCIDPRLGHIFQDLQDFSWLANFVSRTNRKVDPDQFQELMTSIQYRLIFLEDAINDTIGECLRLAMLSYVTTLFLQASRVSSLRIRFAYLDNQQRSMWRGLQVTESLTATTKLALAWALMVGSVTSFDEKDEVWVLPKLAALRESLGQTWPEAKETLKSVMWTEATHDAPGVKVYERLVLHIAKVPLSRSRSRSVEELD